MWSCVADGMAGGVLGGCVWSCMADGMAGGVLGGCHNAFSVAGSWRDLLSARDGLQFINARPNLLQTGVA